MKLSLALGLRGHESIAIVGAGGKTSTMVNLASELPGRVIFLTTTYFGNWQTEFSDRHIIIRTPEQVSEVEQVKAEKIIITSPQISDDRLAGLDSLTLDALHAYSKNHQVPLFIEADGAGQLPIKTPAEYEPAIPNWVDAVLVLAGLGVVGKPLNEKTVHRPGRFSKITGLPINQTIRVEHVASLLSSPQGGLKDIPKGSKRFLFLNQADGDLLKAMGKRLAQHLLPYYERTLVGSLKQTGQAGAIFSVHTQTAGIILAAGGSDRLGRSKQFLDWRGKPYIKQVTDTALEAGLNPLIVVTGEDHEAIGNALRDYPVKIVHNSNWDEGQSTSMHLGLASLPEICDSTVFLLCDQPQISPVLIRSLIERRAETLAPIIAPTAGGKRANPVLFGRETFDALETVTGDRGGRAVFNQFKVEWLPWVDARITLDVDQPGDEEILCRAYFGIE